MVSYIPVQQAAGCSDYERQIQYQQNSTTPTLTVALETQDLKFNKQQLKGIPVGHYKMLYSKKFAEQRFRLLSVQQLSLIINMGQKTSTWPIAGGEKGKICGTIE